MSSTATFLLREETLHGCPPEKLVRNEVKSFKINIVRSSLTQCGPASCDHKNYIAMYIINYIKKDFVLCLSQQVLKQNGAMREANRWLSLRKIMKTIFTTFPNFLKIAKTLNINHFR